MRINPRNTTCCHDSSRTTKQMHWTLGTRNGFFFFFFRSNGNVFAALNHVTNQQRIPTSLPWARKILFRLLESRKAISILSVARCLFTRNHIKMSCYSYNGVRGEFVAKFFHRFFSFVDQRFSEKGKSIKIIKHGKKVDMNRKNLAAPTRFSPDVPEHSKFSILRFPENR